MRLNQDYSAPANVHSFQRVEGVLALDRKEIVEEENFSEGDLISWYALPGGKVFVCKHQGGTEISRISASYLYLKSEISVEEK